MSRIGLKPIPIPAGVTVMIEGDSGILACSPPDRRPVWEATSRPWPRPVRRPATCRSTSATRATGMTGIICSVQTRLWLTGTSATTSRM